MSKGSAPFLVLAVATVLAGCGGGSKSSSGGGGGHPSGITVGNCLNVDENFLVAPEVNVVNGESPGGVNFTLTFYDSNEAAAAAIKKKNPKFTALVEDAVIDFRGNPSPYAGAPPAKISKTELDAIKRCIDKSK
jgi:ABC-type glycerol-3-phosphate transport system substrate-binding protein